jgi:hypothetical protein
MAVADLEKLQQEIARLSPQSLADLREYVEFLKFKEQRQGSPWLKTLYDQYAPVRQAILESGMTEKEVDELIDRAIVAARQERKPSRSS